MRISASTLSILSITLTTPIPFAGCTLAEDELEPALEFRAKPSKLGGGYNAHLSTRVEFQPIPANADVDRGRRLFGIAEDLETEDNSEALFEGHSVAAGKVIESNQRSCFTCHRGLSEGLGLPAPPLSDHVDLGDPLFTGLDADAQQDPDGFHNLDQLGLIKYRVNRFDPRPDPGNGLRQVFGWRKSIRLLNVGLQHGFLNDLRGRFMFEVDRGAVFSHTQEGDARFDDLFTVQDGADLQAFQFSIFTQPELAALRDPSHPFHDTLVEDPYFTVPIVTAEQENGREVFDEYCYTCHNTPNVFSAIDHVEPLANGERPANAISWAPAVSRAYNVGVSERNRHGLRFTEFIGPGPDDFAPIVVQLANEDGTILEHTVTFDIGLAMTTGRAVDIGRFKVPQLRNLASNGPYFHDNSAATITEVVDYFNSEHYNDSADGRNHPIKLTNKQRADLIAFLSIL